VLACFLKKFNLIFYVAMYFPAEELHHFSVFSLLLLVQSCLHSSKYGEVTVVCHLYSSWQKVRVDDPGIVKEDKSHALPPREFFLILLV
jgi:hypothetical protein